MKKLITLIFIATTFATLAPAYAQQRQYVIGVSPYLIKDDREKVYQRVGAFILEGADNGDVVDLYDAVALKPIARITIPDVPNNPRARVTRLKGELLAWKNFCKEEPAHQPEQAATIQLPQFLALVSSHVKRMDSPLTVVLIGSPFYIDKDEPAFNTTDGFFPSDGHLLTDLKGSVFGVAEKRGLLKDVTVHFAYLHEAFITDDQRNSISRFWTLFIGEQGGSLASFAADLSLIVDRARGNVRQPFMKAEINKSDSKIQMHRIIRRERAAESATSWIENDAAPVAAPAPAVTSGKLKVGIRWTPDVDLDLYVCPRPGAVELYYKKNRSADGIHVKDFLTSPSKSNGYETVEFSSDVDIRQVTAAVNFYSGACPGGVTGTVRIMFNDKLYQGDFKIGATKGNSGGDSSSRDKSPFWQVLDIPKIVGLNR